MSIHEQFDSFQPITCNRGPYENYTAKEQTLLYFNGEMNTLVY